MPFNATQSPNPPKYSSRSNGIYLTLSLKYPPFILLRLGFLLALLGGSLLLLLESALFDLPLQSVDLLFLQSSCLSLSLGNPHQFKPLPLPRDGAAKGNLEGEVDLPQHEADVGVAMVHDAGSSSAHDLHPLQVGAMRGEAFRHLQLGGVQTTLLGRLLDGLLDELLDERREPLAAEIELHQGVGDGLAGSKLTNQIHPPRGVTDILFSPDVRSKPLDALPNDGGCRLLRQLPEEGRGDLIGRYPRRSQFVDVCIHLLLLPIFSPGGG